MRFLTVIFSFALALAGCATPQTVTINRDFDQSQHDKYMGDGDSTIKGQGFLRQKGGGVVTCAGSEVLALPATSFFEEVIQVVKEGNKPNYEGKAPKKYNAIVKRKECDAEGNFVFTNIPAGEWFVLTEVVWQVGRYNREGGPLMSRVNVSEGGSTNVLLNSKDRIR